MRTYIKIIQVIADIARYIVEIAIVIIMLLTVADVLGRLLLNTTILGVTEYSQMIMAIILLSAGFTAVQDGHIKVDIVMNAVSRTVQNICAIITWIFSAVIAGLLASSTYGFTARAFRDNQTFTTLGIVKWPFFLSFAIAMSILSLAAISLILKSLLETMNDDKGGAKP